MSTSTREANHAIAPLIRRETLAVRVATIVKRYIIQEPLKRVIACRQKTVFADWLNVSRVVLREALVS